MFESERRAEEKRRSETRTDEDKGQEGILGVEGGGGQCYRCDLRAMEFCEEVAVTR